MSEREFVPMLVRSPARIARRTALSATLGVVAVAFAALISISLPLAGRRKPKRAPIGTSSGSFGIHTSRLSRS